MVAVGTCIVTANIGDLPPDFIVNIQKQAETKDISKISGELCK